MNASGVHLKFTLLDLPPLQDGIQNNQVEADFNQAEINLKTAIDQSKLLIRIKIKTILGMVSFNV